MKKPASVEAYITDQPVEWQPALQAIRALMEQLGLDETIKWAFPTFMLKGKNVAAIYVNKAFAGIWFFQGALLPDPNGLLHNAQESKTQAMRQLRFYHPGEVDLTLAEAFLLQAIENERQGLRVKIERPSFHLDRDTPPELKAALNSKPAFQSAFLALSPGKQREYCEYIASAKRTDTKQRRLEKIIPMVKEGTGLSDKYK